MKTIFLTLLTLTSLSSFAGRIETKCGVRAGSMGMASLVWNGEDQIILANGPGRQELLEQADTAVGKANGESGTQNGVGYCLNIETNGKTKKIVGGYRVEDYIKTVCGVRTGGSGNAFIVNEKNKIILVLATAGKNQDLADEADGAILGGTQIGKPYCLNVQYVGNQPTYVLKVFNN